MNNRPVNDHEVLAELDRRTKVYGSGPAVAKQLGVSPKHLHTVKSGCQPPSRKIAVALDFELRWVRKRKRKKKEGD